jgi:N-acetylmuramoyl-L-alanine amidase
MARHKNGGPNTLWEKYPAAQLQSCFALAKALFDRYHLDDVRGHDDIAPARKNDPGPAFPMQELRASLNLREGTGAIA